MKKKFLVCVFGVMSVVFIGINPGFCAISGSAHDFSGAVWSGHQTCTVCHTPHGAGSTIAPLWNHTLSSATYTIYSSPSLQASVGQPSASSKACLSCHDGTVALDAFGGNLTGTTFLTGADNLGTDISNDHPVSFAYTTALATADGGLYDPAAKTVTSLGGKTIAAGMLIGGNLECGSCHDVHAGKGDAGVSGNHLLLVNNAGSALCLTCHNK